LSGAEALKIEHGHALVEEAIQGQTVTLGSRRGFMERAVNLEHLRRIMGLRLEEIFELIALELSQANLLPYLRAGIFLCGGGARVRGIETLAGNIFGLPVSVGCSRSISGLKSALDQPEFATALGLVKYGFFRHRKRKENGGLARGLRGRLGAFFRRDT
jgi:cell division protein FtsA